ncbi:O-antigen ligase family protein [Alloacidobacterium dinghuense]|uniref:O-antigen ligase family protein n=1 Tax=Alloacidobacterium dinghuense TaxID=2763107 RepID=A0A7G8BLS1_9BACT|nr:O-antigen ligase family protein [Alloacidobacterium dinghuense]QNI33491.1 O-antigen ligase family protein [Alloacidobacterium dinghuense]
MPPNVASIIFWIGIFGLFLLDRRGKTPASKALWIPTAWLFFCSSRSLSLWLGVGASDTSQASVYLEGSPVDRAVFMALEIAALIVVISRRQRVGPILRNNWAIWLFFSYAAFSIFWSDYPLVTFKHWIKGIGDVMMVLIVLTEANVSDAIKHLFTRLGFVLVPLSLLFIRYLPQLGRVLNKSWLMEPVGVATQKNGLGELCDFIGIAFLWRFRSAYIDRKDPNRKRRLLALGTVLAMIVWLLWICDSMTSICALSMASAVMLLSTTPVFRRRPASVHLLAAGVIACTVYALFFQSSGTLIQGLGRNPTLTGRTEAWPILLRFVNNRLVGVGYESFWLGSRLERVWAEPLFSGFQINEAHNGYVEILLTLGWIGEALLGILIATGYRNAIGVYRRDPDIGSLRLAFLLATVITGFTEGAFRMMGPPWIVLLLATIAPVYAVRKSGSNSRVGSQGPWLAQETDAVREEVPVGSYSVALSQRAGRG